MANSRYFNEEGEPLLTAAQARQEDEIDAETVRWAYYETSFRAMGAWPA